MKATCPRGSRMDNLFSEEATIEVVGLFLGHGGFEVKQYLMTRQAPYGFEPLTLDSTQEHFWRAPHIVSYTGSVTLDSTQYARRDFVAFEVCSAKITAWYILDENYQTRYHLKWDARNTRLMNRYLHTAASWCADVEERCTGEAYPFNDKMDCQAFFLDSSRKEVPGYL